MLDAIVECLVERNKTAGIRILNFLVILFNAGLVMASILVFLFFPQYFTLIFVFLGLGIFVTWLSRRYINVEYEYAYFEGEFTVDRIANRSKRKRLKKVSFAKLDSIVPAASRNNEGRPDNGHKIYNYSAHNPDIKDYIAVIHDENEGVMEIVFSPNEELLEVLNRKYPRKVTL